MGSTSYYGDSMQPKIAVTEGTPQGGGGVKPACRTGSEAPGVYYNYTGYRAADRFCERRGPLGRCPSRRRLCRTFRSR
jgi:hypothetical protein